MNIDKWGKVELTLLVGFLLLLVLFFVQFLPPTLGEADSELFVVREGDHVDLISEDLESSGLVRSDDVFKAFMFFYGNEVAPGGYRLSSGMGVWDIAGTLSKAPVTKWVRLEEGMRKEEMASILVKNLNWDEEDLQEFLRAPEEIDGMIEEGMYFPDKYLFPVDDSGQDIAWRMFNRFNEEMHTLFEESLDQNIRWDTAITLASIVQREATEGDRSLVAGILWNRLLDDMKLEVDATVQYARGEADDGWWAPIVLADREIDSPYNTYIHEELPPSPISNPGVESVEAVLYPEDTECLYYIHADREIYCSRTYDGHLRNIETHLR